MYSRVHRIVSSTMMRNGNHSYCKSFRAGSYANAKVIDGYRVEYLRQEGSLSILIWNPVEPCLHIVLYDTDSVASLIWVGYDGKCTVDGKMERGTGTRRMLQFAFDLAKREGATHIELMDDAKIDCDGKKIELSPMYFLQHGMTWYEAKFGFQPHEQYRDEYAEMKRNRDRLKGLDQKTCSFFTRSNVKTLLREIEGDRDVFYKMSWILKL